MSRIWRGALGISIALLTVLVIALVGVLAAALLRAPALPARRLVPGDRPRVTFVPAINGVSVAPDAVGHVPSYRVRPREHLVMRVAVTVPKHVTITALWFGISTGTWGSGPKGSPVGMNPILAHYTLPLSAGIAHVRLALAYPAPPPRHQPVPELCLVRPPAARQRRGAHRHAGHTQQLNRQLIWGGGLHSQWTPQQSATLQ